MFGTFCLSYIINLFASTADCKLRGVKWGLMIRSIGIPPLPPITNKCVSHVTSFSFPVLREMVGAFKNVTIKLGSIP